MSQPIKNVLIIGAGGNLGPSILTALDNHPAFNVSILSRAGSKSTFPSHIKVHTIPDSYPQDALITVFKGQDAIIDLAPLKDTDLHKRFVDAAIDAGVSRYMPPEWGSNTAEPRVVAAVPIFKGKTTMRDYLISKESTGLTWTGLINGPFFDWGLSNGFTGFDLKNKKARIYDDGDHYTDMTVLATIGKAVPAILLKPEGTKNRYVHINSFRVTQNQILAALEKATGGDKWEVEHASSAEEGRKGVELLQKGNMAGVGPAICGVEYSGEDFMNFEKFGLWNQKLGLPKTNEGLDETVKAIVEKEHVK